MTAKPKKIDISSTKSLDITTKKMSDVSTKTAEPKIVLNGQKHIKDVSPAESTDSSSSSTKINISENLASNLKTSIETKKVIEPIEPAKDNTTDDKPSDDLTEVGDKNRDESFVDKISDDESEKDEPEKPDPKSKQDENDSDKENESIEPDTDKTVSEEETADNKDDEKTDDDKTSIDPEAEQPPQDSGDKGIVNELAEQAADNKKQKQEEKVQGERDQKVEALITDKKYYVPIGQITHRRNTRLFIIIILLIIVGGLFAINLAIDAGMLDIGVEPLTDIIAL